MIEGRLESFVTVRGDLGRGVNGEGLSTLWASIIAEFGWLDGS